MVIVSVLQAPPSLHGRPSVRFISCLSFLTSEVKSPPPTKMHQFQPLASRPERGNEPGQSLQAFQTGVHVKLQLPPALFGFLSARRRLRSVLESAEDTGEPAEDKEQQKQTAADTVAGLLHARRHEPAAAAATACTCRDCTHLGLACMHGMLGKLKPKEVLEGLCVKKSLIKSGVGNKLLMRFHLRPYATQLMQGRKAAFPN